MTTAAAANAHRPSAVLARVGNHRRDEIGWIGDGNHGDDVVSDGRLEPGRDGDLVAETARKANHADVLVMPEDVGDACGGAVGRAIVDEENLVILVVRFEGVANLRDEGVDAVFVIAERCDDRDKTVPLYCHAGSRTIGASASNTS